MDAHQLNAALQQIVLTVDDLTRLAIEEKDQESKRIIIEAANLTRDAINKLATVSLSATEEHHPFRVEKS